MTYLFTGNTTVTNDVDVSFDGATVDAFGRLRTSSPYTLFDSYFSVDEKPRVWDTLIEGTGNATFDANIASVVFDVGTSSGDKVVRQTKNYFQYQPGKSLLTLTTFVLDEAKANLRQRVGYFDTNNGVFLERDGTDVYIVKRTSTSGTPQDIRIPQSDWNGDKIDGTGESGQTLDNTKSHIFFTDVEWLGVGTVRAGFVINGSFIIAHSFNHANIESNVYMTTAVLPVRYEMENTGVTTSNSLLKQICSTVISEAGYAPEAIVRSASTDLEGRQVSDTTFTPVMSLRLKQGYTDQVVTPTALDLFGLQSTAFSYKIISDANVIGGTWTSAPGSVVEYNFTSNVLGAGGFDLKQGMFVGGTSSQPTILNLRDFSKSLALKANIGGTPEVLTIAVKATTNNDDALDSISWEEHN